MKRLFTLLLAITLVSCQSDLDKKVVITEYKQVMEKLQKDNKEYTAEDFTAAADEMSGYVLAAMANPNKPLDVTYKQLLEKAKATNAKNKLELANYNNSIEKLRNQFSIKVLDGHYEQLSDDMVYNDGYTTKLEVHNLSNKKVTAYAGNLIFKNSKGEVIFDYPVEESMKLDPAFKFETSGSFLIMEDANLTELKALPFKSIKTEWNPTKLIYEDGSRLESLPKPASLL